MARKNSATVKEQAETLETLEALKPLEILDSEVVEAVTETVIVEPAETVEAEVAAPDTEPRRGGRGRARRYDNPAYWRRAATDEEIRFGTFVRRIRSDAFGLGQAEMATLLGVSTSTVSKWEQPTRKDNSVAVRSKSSGSLLRNEDSNLVSMLSGLLFQSLMLTPEKTEETGNTFHLDLVKKYIRLALERRLAEHFKEYVGADKEICPEFYEMMKTPNYIGVLFCIIMKLHLESLGYKHVGPQLMKGGEPATKPEVNDILDPDNLMDKLMVAQASLGEEPKKRIYRRRKKTEEEE